MQSFFFCQSRTGIDTMAVCRTVRIKGNTFICPVDKILTGVMSPEFQPALYLKRRILKKYVISALIPAEAIGIIQPAAWGCLLYTSDAADEL